MAAQVVSDSAALHCLVEVLLARADLGKLRRLHPLAGGANNRLFLAEGTDGQALLKVYFRHPADPRDRLRAECAFLRFAWGHGIRAVPRPLADDPEGGAALYEFIPGRPLTPIEVDQDAVAQAMTFYRALNCWRDTPEAQALPDASEACFSLEDHLGCVDRRVRGLLYVEPESPAHQEAARFADRELIPIWAEVQERVRHAADRLGFTVSTPILPGDRRISPSDFGFHNCLRTAAGTLRFIDFEYAGWDDPAKLICDFFCQPAVPVPPACYARFASFVLEDQLQPEQARQRADLLLPVYRMKWCCILLNEFLPVSRDRRRFASDGSLATDRLAVQLDKARRALRAVRGVE